MLITDNFVFYNVDKDNVFSFVNAFEYLIPGNFIWNRVHKQLVVLILTFMETHNVYVLIINR